MDKIPNHTNSYILKLVLIICMFLITNNTYAGLLSNIAGGVVGGYVAGKVISNSQDKRYDREHDHSIPYHVQKELDVERKKLQQIKIIESELPDIEGDYKIGQIDDSNYATTLKEYIAIEQWKEQQYKLKHEHKAKLEARNKKAEKIYNKKIADKKHEEYLAKEIYNKKEFERGISFAIKFLTSGLVVIIILFIITSYFKKQNDKEFTYLADRAEQGDAEAQYKLGKFFNDNNNFGSAKYWYQQAAKQGHKRAYRSIPFI